MGLIEAILRAKGGTSSWLSGQILRNREFAYETDNYGLKIGDDTLRHYNELPYLIPPRNGKEGKYLKVENGYAVWADGVDTTAIWTAINAKYTKPADGIPKTDLDSYVQTSLGKADTAIQDISGKQDIATLDNDVAALGFVKNTVDNLTKYYLKTETYTQAEVNALIGSISGFTYEIYASLDDVTDPQSNVLYLIGPTGSGSDKYEEYVYPNNNFVKIGDTSIDLSGYVTTSDLNTALADYTTTTDLTTLLAGYQTKIDANNKLDYSLIDNTPTIPSDTSDLTNGAGFITSADIPTDVSDFNNDAGYITSADIPPIPNGTYIDTANAGWGPNQVTGAFLRAAYFYNGEVPSKVGDYVYSKSTRCLHKITSITQSGGENVANADFIAFFSGFDGSYISLSGKPTLGTAAALDVPASGDAATTEVVKGDDSRLSDARTPTSHTHTTSDITDFPTIPAAPGTLDTTQTTAQSTSASEALSGSVKLHKVAKTGTYSDLIGTPTIPDAQIQSDWNQSDNTKKDYIKNKPTIPSVSGKADKVSGATSGNFAGLDSNGNLTDSGHKHSDYLTSHQDISGKADKVSGATSGNFAGLDSNGNLTDSGHKHSDYLTSHQDISGKADKVSGAINGDIAGLDSNGNLTDSGISTTDASDAVSKKHSHTNKTLLDMIPSSLGTAGQAIVVNSGATGLKFATVGGGGGGLSDYDFTELSAPTISGGATTITFVSNQRNCIEFSTNADLAIALISNNKSDNYMWITNSHGSNSIDVTFSSIKFGSTTINDIKGTASIPSIEAGETLEIGFIITNSKARITSRIL